MKNKAPKNPVRLAAIDIGSNAARLLIKTATLQRDGSLSLQKEQFIRFPLRLGIDVFQNGKISEEREQLFLRMIKAFKQLMIIYGVSKYRACATSALRDAKNGRKVLRHICRRTGIDIELISGDEEARIIYDNHTEKFLSSSEKNGKSECTFLCVDVGGGSTEISVIAQNKFMGSRSFNVGTLRLLSGLVDLDSVDDMSDEIRQMVGTKGRVAIIGSGGNINKLYRLVPKKVRRTNRLTVAQLDGLYRQLSSIDYAERMEKFNLRPNRADVIVPAAQIFLSIARATRASEIIVPTIGLADGIIQELSSELTSSPS